MAEKTKAFDFAPNVPVTVEFSFDEPKTGTSKDKAGNDRTWYLYGCRRDGKTASFFAQDGLQDALTNAKVKKGTRAVITKVIEEGQKTPKWCVEIDGIFYGEGAAGRTHRPAQAPAEHPDIDDLVNTYVTIWDKMAQKMDGRIAVDQLREAVTSVFIQATRNGEYAYAGRISHEPVVQEALANAKDDPYADVPPPDEKDDLPF